MRGVPNWFEVSEVGTLRCTELVPLKEPFCTWLIGGP